MNTIIFFNGIELHELIKQMDFVVLYWTFHETQRGTLGNVSQNLKTTKYLKLNGVK